MKNTKTKYFWSELGVTPKLFNQTTTTQNVGVDNVGCFLFSIKGDTPTTRYYATGKNKKVEEAELTLPARLTFEAFCQKMGVNIISKTPFDSDEFEYTLEGVEGFFYASNEPGSDVGFYQEKQNWGKG